MLADILLNHLHKVRKSGRDSWMACCPAHDDRTPSLSVSEAADGHILIHCFAGCEPSEILANVGLKMSDLMPERDAHYFDDRPPEQRAHNSRGEEAAYAIEFRLALFERMVKDGHKFTPEENKARMRDYAQLKRMKGNAA